MGVLTLVARESFSNGCTKDTCPSTESMYGYAPALSAGWFFFALFTIMSLAYFFLTFKYRYWTLFGFAVGIGCTFEAIGYIARLILHYDPFSEAGFKMAMCFLSLGPVCISAGLYMLFAELAMNFNQSLPLLNPKHHFIVFVSCDAVSVLFQIAGGAAAGTVKTSSMVMLAGTIFQLLTLLAFGVLAVHYFIRLVQCHDKFDNNEAPYVHKASMALWRQTHFRLFLLAINVAYSLLLIRCFYRVAELSGGWGSNVMRNQSLFTGLESFAVSAVAVLLANFHPGQCMGLSKVNEHLIYEDSEKKRSSTSSSGRINASPMSSTSAYSSTTIFRPPPVRSAFDKEAGMSAPQTTTDKRSSFRPRDSTLLLWSHFGAFKPAVTTTAPDADTPEMAEKTTTPAPAPTPPSNNPLIARVKQWVIPRGSPGSTPALNISTSTSTGAKISPHSAHDEVHQRSPSYPFPITPPRVLSVNESAHRSLTASSPIVRPGPATRTNFSHPRFASGVPGIMPTVGETVVVEHFDEQSGESKDNNKRPESGARMGSWARRMNWL